MHGAILLTLLVSTQTPADAARVAPAPDPAAIERLILGLEVGNAAPRRVALWRPVARQAVRGQEGPQVLRPLILEPPVEDRGDFQALPPEPAEEAEHRELILARKNFDERVFGTRQPERDQVAHLQMILRHQLFEAERAHQIDVAGRRKLLLAGAGDIRRFLDRVEAQRAEFERARQDRIAAALALRAAVPLGREFQAGPFGAGSLFDKTLALIVGSVPGPARAPAPRADPTLTRDLDSDWRSIVVTLAADRGPALGDPPGPRIYNVQVERGQTTFFPLTLQVRRSGRPGGLLEPPTGPAAPREPVDVEDLEIRAENFDRWVFGGAATEAGRRAHLAGVLDRRIDRAGRDHAIDPDLDRELRRAGEDDARRLLDRIEGQQAEFERDRHLWDIGLIALRRLEPLAAKFRAGPYGPGSRFAEVLERAGR